MIRTGRGSATEASFLSQAATVVAAINVSNIIDVRMGASGSGLRVG
jgi:hypothetical protein